jgi:tetratricopeptide (TPR) repeat protein
LQAQLMSTMAETYQSLGLDSRAESLYRLALGIREGILGPQNADTLATKFNLAMVIADQGQHTDAEKLYREVLQTQRSVRGNENADTLRTAAVLAWDLSEQGHYEEAEKLARQTLEVQQRALGLDNADTQYTSLVLTGVLRRSGRYSEAVTIDREGLDSVMRAIDRKGADSIMRTGAFVRLLDWEIELSDDLNFARRLPEAETLLRTLLSKNRQIFGASGYPTVETEAILAGVLKEEESMSRRKLLQRKARPS